MHPGRLLCLGLLLAGASLCAAAEMDSGQFERALERAWQLNITAPWRQSQDALDRLRPHLGVATADQYARFMLAEARNLAVRGRQLEALQTLDELLMLDMSPRWRVLAYARGASIAQTVSRYGTAFDYLNRALELLRHEPGRDSTGSLYAIAALLYSLVEEHESAQRYGRVALGLAESAGDARALCLARVRLGDAYRRAARLDPARRQLEQALDDCGESGAQLSLAIAELYLGDLMRSRARLSRAEQLIRGGLERMQQNGFVTGIAQGQLYAARLAHERGEPDRVRALLEPALARFEVDESWRYLAEALRLLAASAKTRGDWAGALAFYERYIAAQERFLELSRNRQTAFLEVQFDQRHAAQELELLREQQRVRELGALNRAQERRLQIGLFALLSVLVGVLVSLLVRATRDRRRFRSLSERDSLTGLSNHTRFFDLAERTLESARHKRRPFTLVLADIDHFKRVNDRYGHVAGDRVLRRVAARLRAQFGDGGIVGRIGGEEFAVALPGVDAAGADRRLRALRAALAETRADDEPAGVTLSFGVAEPIDDDSLAALRARADRALYEAKRRGRDRVVHAPGPD